MSERFCIKCGNALEAIKNGFYFITPDGLLKSSDLWGCIKCRRFQIHGIPSGSFPWRPVYGYVDAGELTDDLTSPVNEAAGSFIFQAYLDPTIIFLNPFYEHMKKRYPEWNFSKPRKTQTTGDITTVRDVMKDRVRDLLAEYHRVDILEVDANLVANIADEAFSVCGISEKEQDEEW
jgi:hypothetical protein